MTYLVDANLSPAVAGALNDAGFEVIHVREVGLVSASDGEIADFALSRALTVISADSDFASLLALSRGSAPSLVLLRSADHLSPREQAQILIANLPGVEGELVAGSVVSIVRGHVRVKRLPLS